LKRVEQQPDHHPEGNVWEHILLVVDLAAEGRHLSEDPRVFMWSALLHDLGKIAGIQMKNRFIRSATWEGMAGEKDS
jgi:HD superfamily phosphodiesterase